MYVVRLIILLIINKINKTGFLSEIDQYTFQYYNSCTEETNYLAIPFFVEFNTTTDLDNYLISSQSESGAPCGGYGKNIPNFGVEFNNIDYDEKELSYLLISQDPLDEITSQYFFNYAASVYATSQLSSAFGLFFLNHFLNLKSKFNK